MSNKKAHVSVGIGTVSLLLVLAVLSMALLVVLSVLSAQNDKGLTDRAVAVAVLDQGLYAEAEELRANLTDAVNGAALPEEEPEEVLTRLASLFPEGAETEGDSLSLTLNEGAQSLFIRLRLKKDSGLWQFTYSARKLYAATEEEFEEWN